MSCIQYERSEHPCLVGFNPAGRADAPLIAWVQAQKPEFRARGAQIVSCIFREFEEFRSENSTGSMFASVFFIGFAAPVAKKACQWIAGAGPECGSQDVFLQRHAFFLTDWQDWGQ